MVLNLSEDKKYFIIESCEQEEYDQLKVAYTKKAEGYRFNPLFKKKLWDGNISFVKGAAVPSGTWSYLIDVSKECNWKDFKINGISRLVDDAITKESFQKWCDSFFSDLEFKPRDYQIDAAYKILKYKKCLSELATSAGKTLICFIVIAYLLDNNIIKNVLMIVPTVQLVLQSSGDFSQYNTKKLPLTIQQAYAGFKDNPDANITIGTFQTLTKIDKEWYEKFDCMIVDETHRANAVSIKNILEHCWSCEYRFGVSGTMPKRTSADFLTLQTYLGPLVTEVKAKTLQDAGYISNCDIVQIRMDYVSENKKKEFSEAYKLLISQEKGSSAFNLEKNFIIENEKRFNFINGIISKTTKNTLVLFHRIVYGQKLFKYLKTNLQNKHVYYIDGNVDKDIRNEITNRMDKYDDVILVASYATLSTGISINKIFNIFFTESFKSPYIVIQSIGRGLRLKDKENRENKEINHVTIIDLVDDFRYGKYINYIYKHGLERMRLYKEQKYPTQIKKVKF